MAWAALVIVALWVATASTRTLEGEDYPALATIRELGDEKCAEGFAAWVGTPLESSELTVSYLYPDEENWDFDGTIKCIAVPPKDVSGTLEGSGR